MRGEIQSMTIELFAEIYNDIAEATKNLPDKQGIALRQASLNSVTGLVKLAFDSRRINQETEFNPRRGLQFYNRSDAFISQAVAQRIETFKHLKSILEDFKSQFGRKPEWQDSYLRVLLNYLDRALRTVQQDDDYTDNQPGVGSFDYLEEMLYVRYRLTMDQISTMSDEEIKKSLLSKDSELTKDVNHAEIMRSDVGTQSYDTLLEKLFGGIKATKENPEVERTITITIKDKLKGD